MHTDTTSKRPPGSAIPGMPQTIGLYRAAHPTRCFSHSKRRMPWHTLHRTDPADGAVAYWAGQQGLVLPTTIDTAQQSRQIGGLVMSDPIELFQGSHCGGGFSAGPRNQRRRQDPPLPAPTANPAVLAETHAIPMAPWPGAFGCWREGLTDLVRESDN
jgi:hypothetical protein